MNSKEKAKELFDKYQDNGSIWYSERTKKYALIAVDEMIKEIKENDYCYTNNIFTPRLEYWQEVKKEIEKL